MNLIPIHLGQQSHCIMRFIGIINSLARLYRKYQGVEDELNDELNDETND